MAHRILGNLRHRRSSRYWLTVSVVIGGRSQAHLDDVSLVEDRKEGLQLGCGLGLCECCAEGGVMNGSGLVEQRGSGLGQLGEDTAATSSSVHTTIFADAAYPARSHHRSQTEQPPTRVGDIRGTAPARRLRTWPSRRSPLLRCSMQAVAAVKGESYSIVGSGPSNGQA